MNLKISLENFSVRGRSLTEDELKILLEIFRFIPKFFLARDFCSTFSKKVEK
jgi:hypothetical protein